MSNHNHQKKSHETARSTPAATPGAVEAGDIGSEPATDHIRLRAYEISLARNGGHGDELADWIQAEQELATPHADALAKHGGERVVR